MKKLTLREAQSIFLQNVAKLILWAFDNGYELTGGELQRTEEQQEVYVLEGKSKTMDSDHLKRLAIDLNLFIDGVYKTDRESYKPLADFWKGLHSNNVAGYDWGWDANHFAMKQKINKKQSVREPIKMDRMKSKKGYVK
jgi:hypothetical protein